MQAETTLQKILTILQTKINKIVSKKGYHVWFWNRCSYSFFQSTKVINFMKVFAAMHCLISTVFILISIVLMQYGWQIFLF